uniref:Cell division cycle protein 26 homolog n=1 Tax=Steinernema glaseri TaxID=37863 RepID=A0A1I7ZUC1_9BILA
MIRRPLTKIEIKDDDRKLMVEALKKAREERRLPRRDASPMDEGARSDRSAQIHPSTSTTSSTSVKTRSQTRAAAQQNVSN